MIQVLLNVIRCIIVVAWLFVLFLLGSVMLSGQAYHIDV